MKAVILAAGKGSRLGKLTTGTPKSMLQLNDEHTLLSYNIKQLSEVGVDSIIVISGYESEKLENHAREQAEKFNIELNIVFNPFWDNCNVLGSLYMSLNYIQDNFLFLHADTIVDIEVLKGIMNSKSEACIAVDFKKCGDEEMKFWLKENSLERITKQNIGKESNGEFVGVAKFDYQLIKYFAEQTKKLFQSGNLNYYMEEVLDRGLIEGSISVDYFDATHYRTIEVDFEEDLQMAKELFKNI